MAWYEGLLNALHQLIFLTLTFAELQEIENLSVNTANVYE